jgi:predicted dehydrogenase
MISKTVSVGLVGYGMAGRVFHAPVISCVPGLKLAAIVERHGRESLQRYPDIAIVTDAEDLFHMPEIDLVVVATPNDTHFKLARNALLAGKHVVVDKPFTISFSQADELIALARQMGKILTVFQNRRWDGDFQTVCKIVQNNRVGRLVEFESSFDRFRPGPKQGAWREQDVPGGGLLYDIAPHLVDQGLLLFGWPLSVTAAIRTQRDNAAVDDKFTISLRYPSLDVKLEAGMLARQGRPRFVLNGTDGSFVKYGLDPQEDALRSGALPTSTPWGKEPEDRWGMLDTCNDGIDRRERIETVPGRYCEFYENVRDVIANGAQLAVMPEQARDAIRIVELAIESDRLGKTVEATR